MRKRPHAAPSMVRTIDLAHPPLSQETVEEELLRAWMDARNAPGVRVLKVIHGYGSTGRGGLTQVVVRNWGSRMRGRFRAVIPGEEYSLYDPDTQAMRQDVGIFDDAELGSGNRGITYFWIR